MSKKSYLVFIFFFSYAFCDKLDKMMSEICEKPKNWEAAKECEKWAIEEVSLL